jgi:hypothetical protein
MQFCSFQKILTRKFNVTKRKFFFVPAGLNGSIKIMFSHVVIFWTNPEHADAADKVIAGAEKFLKHIPGLKHFHVGKMIGSARPVVDQTYQLALNTAFISQQAQDDYQVHPQHLEFVAQCVKPYVKKVVVYDFE